MAKYIKIFTLLLFVLSLPSLAQTNTKKRVFKGEITDSTASEIFSRKVKLNPVFGTEDMYIRTNSSTVFDLSDLGDKNNYTTYHPDPKSGLFSRGSKFEKDGKGYRIFTGAEEGATQVLFYEKSSAKPGKGNEFSGRLLKVFNITVTKKDLIKKLRQLQVLIGATEGLTLRIVGDQIVADGKVLVPKEISRVDEVLKKVGGADVLNLIELSPLTLEMFAKKIEEEINGGKNRPRDVRTSVKNGRIFLEGIVDRKVDRDLAERICQTYFPERYRVGSKNTPPARLTFSDLPNECVMLVRIRQPQPKEPDPMISIRVDFVEMSREYTKGFNFRWAPGANFPQENNQNTITFNSQLGEVIANFTGIVANLFPTLSTLARHGHARVLKSTILLVRDAISSKSNSPPKAELEEKINLSFTEIDSQGQPRVVPQEAVSKVSVFAKSAGNSINIDIVASATEILPTNIQNGPSNTQTNTIKTSLVVNDGESAALGGLITERRSVAIERQPGSIDNSSSGFSLFDIGKRNNFQDSKNQFVVFVTPKRLRSPSEGTEKLKRKFRLRK